jgi:hypothetical protein
MFAKVFKCFQVFSFQVFQKHVASVCFKYFNFFTHMLQVFYLNIAYVASVLFECCICSSGYTYVASIYSKCFICFRHMLLQVLHVVSVS